MDPITPNANTIVPSSIPHGAHIDVPDDVVLMIVYACRAGNQSDKYTLSALFNVNRQYRRVMKAHRGEIIRYYTVMEVHLGGECTRRMLYGESYDAIEIGPSDKKKYICYYKFCGELHCDNNRPAVITKDYESDSDDESTSVTESDSSTDERYVYQWYQYGQLHRDGDQPAIMRYNSQEWYQRGKLHRDGDQPSDIYEGGRSYRWHRHGELHRGGDLPAVIKVDNGIEWEAGNTMPVYPPYTLPDVCYIYQWFQHGVVHRDGDMPAVMWDNGRVQKWFCHGRLHREGGLPAVIDYNIREWYVNGRKVRTGSTTSSVATIGTYCDPDQ